MGRSFGGRHSGKNVRFTSLNAQIQAKFERTAALNSFVQTEFTQGASLNAYTSLFTQQELSAALNANIFASTLANGLISYWNLNSDSTDSKAVGNGTDTAITYSGANGKIGNGAGFNGSTSKVVLPNIAAYKPTNFTIAAWVKTTSVTGYHEIFESYNQSGTPQGFEFRLNGAFVEMVVGNGTSFTLATTNNTIPTNEFVHLLGSYDGANIRIYVNGLLLNTTARATGVSYHSDTRVRIGVNNYTGSTETYWWSGAIDDVGLWDRALTTAEVWELYNKGVGTAYPFGDVAPTTTGLLGYWKLDGDSTDSLSVANGTDTAITYSAGNGKLVQGAGFNGSTSVINAGGTIPLNSKHWSIAFWMYPTVLQTTRVITYYGDGPTISQTASTLRIVHSGTVDWNPAGMTLTANAWHHIVFTRDGTVCVAYKNAVIGATDFTQGAVFTTGGNSVRFGNSTAYNEPYTGNLDEIGIWNRALTSPEVTALYNAGTGVQYPF